MREPYLVPLIYNGHLPKSDFEWLKTADSSEALVFSSREPDDYGLFVYVDSDALWFSEVYPEAIGQLFSWASRMGYEFVRLTPDGDTIDDLPTYDW